MGHEINIRQQSQLVDHTLALTLTDVTRHHSFQGNALLRKLRLFYKTKCMRYASGLSNALQ